MHNLIFGLTFAMAITFSAHRALAADFAVDKILGSCRSEFAAELRYAKENLVKKSRYNYDNDYGLDDVAVGAPYDLTVMSFKMDVYFDVEDLKGFSFTYRFTPRFFEDGSCDYIQLDWIAENY